MDNNWLRQQTPSGLQDAWKFQDKYQQEEANKLSMLARLLWLHSNRNK